LRLAGPVDRGYAGQFSSPNKEIEKEPDKKYCKINCKSRAAGSAILGEERIGG